MKIVKYCCFFLLFVPFFLFLPDESPPAEATEVSVYVPENGIPAEYKLYENSYALIIGADIEGKGRGKLGSYSPTKDARVVFDLLKDQYLFQEIIFLKGKNATKEGIFKALDSLAAKARFGDAVFIFFGTHSLAQKKLIEGYGYLTGEPKLDDLVACVDTSVVKEDYFLIPFGGAVNPDQIEKNISIDSLYRKLFDIKAKHLYLIVDAPVIYPGVERSMRVSSGEFFSNQSFLHTTNPLLFSGECTSYFADACYFSKHSTSPGRQILIPATVNGQFEATVDGNSSFTVKVTSALKRESFFVSADQISRKMVRGLPDDKLPLGGLPHVKAVAYGKGDFVFSRKPVKIIELLDAEIARLQQFSQEDERPDSSGWNEQYPLIRFESILDWQSFIFGVYRQEHLFDQLVWDKMDDNLKEMILSGGSLSGSEKRELLKQLNKFIKSNRALMVEPEEDPDEESDGQSKELSIKDGSITTAEDEISDTQGEDEVDYVKGVLLSPEAINLFEKGYEKLSEKEYMLLNRLIIESLYPRFIFKRPEDFMARALELESMKMFVLGTFARDTFKKSKKIVTMSKKEEKKIDLWVQFNSLECSSFLDGTFTPSYLDVFSCMDALKKLINQEIVEVNRKRSNEVSRVRKEFGYSLFSLQRPKELYETQKEYLHRQSTVLVMLRSGLDERLREVNKKYDLYLNSDAVISRLEKILRSFSEVTFFVFEDDFQTEFLKYKRAREAVPVKITIEQPDLSTLARVFDLFLSEEEWEIFQQETKHLNWKLKYHFSVGENGQNIFPELLESYAVNSISGVKRELVPPYQFIQGGCFYKGWLAKEKAPPPVGNEKNEDGVLTKDSLSQNDEEIELELPEDTLYCVDNFYMGRYEVTGGEYMKFSGIENIPMNMHNHPVASVDWNSAASYCSSLGNIYGGKYRLPTKTEWEYVASLKGEGVRYITGEEQFNRDGVNIRGNTGKDIWDWTAPVGSFPPNLFGIYELGGNISEWTLDWHADESKNKGVLDNYQGGSSGKYRSVKGGGWSTDEASLLLEADKKWNSNLGNGVIGFRCVRSYEKY